jgi:hypothetical protein
MRSPDQFLNRRQHGSQCSSQISNKIWIQGSTRITLPVQGRVWNQVWRQIFDKVFEQVSEKEDD